MSRPADSTHRHRLSRSLRRSFFTGGCWGCRMYPLHAAGETVGQWALVPAAPALNLMLSTINIVRSKYGWAGGLNQQSLLFDTTCENDLANRKDESLPDPARTLSAPFPQTASCHPILASC